MKKRKIIFLFIFIIILISIFFIYKNMTKKSKGGNNMSSQEIVDYILNINSYKAKINVQVISNKKINKYIINQEFNKESGCIQEVIEPSNIAGTKITIKDGNLIVENSNLNLTNIFENYKGLEKNDLDLNNFIEDCKLSNNLKIEELNGEILVETKASKESKYIRNKILYINKGKLIPTKLVIKDNNQNSTINIEYNEIELD